MFCALQWWLDNHSEELLAKEVARGLREEEEHRKEAWWLQQQEDEHLALGSLTGVQRQLVSWDVGGRGLDSDGVNHGWQQSVTQPSIPTSLHTLVF